MTGLCCSQQKPFPYLNRPIDLTRKLLNVNIVDITAQTAGHLQTHVASQRIVYVTLINHNINPKHIQLLETEVKLLLPCFPPSSKCPYLPPHLLLRDNWCYTIKTF